MWKGRVIDSKRKVHQVGMGKRWLFYTKGPPKTNVGDGRVLIANRCMGKLGARRIRRALYLGEG